MSRDGDTQNKFNEFLENELPNRESMEAWAALPATNESIESIVALVNALKERSQTQSRETENTKDSFVTIQDLIDFGLITDPPAVKKTDPFEVLVAAGYGGMDAGTPYPQDFGAGWVKVLFDEDSLGESRAIKLVLPNNAFQFGSEGIWQLSINGNIAGHDSSNLGRTINLRMMTASGQIGNNIAIGIGRNVEDTLFSLTGLVNIHRDDISQDIWVEMGGGDSVTGGTLSAGLSLSHVSEYKGSSVPII